VNVQNHTLDPTKVVKIHGKEMLPIYFDMVHTDSIFAYLVLDTQKLCSKYEFEKFKNNKKLQEKNWICRKETQTQSFVIPTDPEFKKVQFTPFHHKSFERSREEFIFYAYLGIPMMRCLDKRFSFRFKNNSASPETKYNIENIEYKNSQIFGASEKEKALSEKRRQNQEKSIYAFSDSALTLGEMKFSSRKELYETLDISGAEVGRAVKKGSGALVISRSGTKYYLKI